MVNAHIRQERKLYDRKINTYNRSSVCCYADEEDKSVCVVAKCALCNWVETDMLGSIYFII